MEPHERPVGIESDFTRCVKDRRWRYQRESQGHGCTKNSLAIRNSGQHRGYRSPDSDEYQWKDNHRSARRREGSPKGVFDEISCKKKGRREQTESCRDGRDPGTPAPRIVHRPDCGSKAWPTIGRVSTALRSGVMAKRSRRRLLAGGNADKTLTRRHSEGGREAALPLG